MSAEKSGNTLLMEIDGKTVTIEVGAKASPSARKGGAAKDSIKNRSPILRKLNELAAKSNRERSLRSGLHGRPSEGQTPAPASASLDASEGMSEMKASTPPPGPSKIRKLTVINGGRSEEARTNYEKGDDALNELQSASEAQLKEAA